MLKPSDPRQLVLDLIPRSTCCVQVAAVVTDRYGSIISWGWNHSGPSGMGLHAEVHAIQRANHDRMDSVFVAGQYSRGTNVNSKPCEECQKLIDKHELTVVYRDKAGKWRDV